MLTAKQKADLRRLLVPLIESSLKAGLGPAIRSEIGRMRDEGPGPGSYTQQILNGRDGRGRGRQQEMPEAARVFARLGLCALTGGGDSGSELEMARTLDIESHYKAAQSAARLRAAGCLFLTRWRLTSSNCSSPTRSSGVLERASSRFLEAL